MRSEREQCVIIGGYTPPKFQAWKRQEPSLEFVEGLPEYLKPLISGSDKWGWRRQIRDLFESRGIAAAAAQCEAVNANE